MGRVMNGWRPWAACMSEPQMPTTVLRTRTSPGPASGTSVCSMVMSSSECTTTRRFVAGLLRAGLLIAVSPGSHCGVTTVGHEDRAGDEGRGVAGEEDDAGGDLL